jgi:membrane protease YdiL (CAAX protease family)
MLNKMTTSLTQPISKKMLLAILIITIGAEVDLYLSRYSYLAETLYNGIMVGSLFLGLKLSPRLRNPQVIPKTKRQLSLQFTGAFLIFFLVSTVNNFYSTIVFQDFSDNYDQYVQSYTDPQTYVDDGTSPNFVSSFFDKVDTFGNDLYSDALAGLEEVWRLAYIVLILIIFKKIFPNRWNKGSRDIFVMLALFISSILFGIDHTLDTEESWPVRVGAIVTFANMGFTFGLILLWTRNLWLAVIVHAVYDIVTTTSWYFFDYAVEVFAFVVLVLHIILFTIEKRKKKYDQPIESLPMAE